MAKKLLVANWKMNPATPREARQLAQATKALAARRHNWAVVICPPAIFLGFLSGGSAKTVRWGVQAVSTHRGEGAYTGEISASQAHYAGAAYALVGHSEARARGETNQTVNQQVKNALSAKLKPIICIGETNRDPAGEYLEPLHQQIKEALAGLKKVDLNNIIFAYEPLWAVGQLAKEADTPENFRQHAIFIRKIINDLFGSKTAMTVPVLYGGSVDGKNAAGFLTEGQADGLLLGRASLKPTELKKIIYAANH